MSLATGDGRRRKRGPPAHAASPAAKKERRPIPPWRMCAMTLQRLGEPTRRLARSSDSEMSSLELR